MDILDKLADELSEVEEDNQGHHSGEEVEDDRPEKEAEVFASQPTQALGYVGSSGFVSDNGTFISNQDSGLEGKNKHHFVIILFKESSIEKY